MILQFWFQIGKGSRGDVTILPTLVINSRQYRGMELEPTLSFVFIYTFLKLLVPGKLDKGAVLKAICSGFEETTEPAICLSEGDFL